MQIARRTILAGTLAPLAAPSIARAVEGEYVKDAATIDQVARDLARFIGHGVKAAGGAGDIATGEWLSDELTSLGFAVSRQSFDVPFFNPTRADVTVAGAVVPVLPLPIVVPTGSSGVSGPLVRMSANGVADRPLQGAIAVIELPFGRWSSATSKAVRMPLDSAFAQGAVAALVITNGPTGEAIALNVDGRGPMFERPVAIVAPRLASPLLAAAAGNAEAMLTVDGVGGKRPSFNFVGRLNRGRGRWFVVSTPRSGWFTCAGERGPGIAIWMMLARWAAKRVLSHNVAFLCNSGHEYENLGAEHALDALMPKPAETDFWLHLGAAAAARDWHDATGTLMPLPSPDPQRYLSVSPALLSAARHAFVGQAGLEAPYSYEQLSAGELTSIVKAGYARVAGVFGAHRFHHVATDDARCVQAPVVARTGDAFIAFAKAALTGIERRSP